MLCISSVRDIVADRFLGFQLSRNIKESVRGFIDAMADVRDGRDNLLVSHPGDFELWILGWFDEESGDIVHDDPEGGYSCPRRIFTGVLAEQMIKKNVEVRDFFDYDGYYSDDEFMSALESEE